MRRFILASTFWILALVLSACGIDPCSLDQNSPTCDTRRTEARATIDSINSDSALRATQAAIQIGAEATKQAISVRATKQVVQAEATASAMNIEATRQALSAASAQSAVIYKATQTFADGEATKVAVSVGGAIERANAERAAVPYGSIFNIVVVWFLLPTLAVAGVYVLGRAAIEAIKETVHKRAAMITYGPPNNPQLAFVTFGADGRPTRFITSEGLPGNTANLLTGRTALDDLEIPDTLKLAAMVESSKRVQAARIAAATGVAPWVVTRGSAESQAAIETPAPETIAPLDEPRVATVSVNPQAWDVIFKSFRPTREKMMLAFDANGEPIYAALGELLSGVIIGRQKQGKTTFMRLLYAQCLMIGVDVRVWDLHEDIVDDLPGASASTTATAIKRSAIEVLGELDRRIRLRLKNGAARPLMVLADEVNQLVGAVPEVVATFERIIAEGRKYDVYCDVSAKGVPADLFGRSWVRDSINTRVAFLTTPGQARLIGFDNDSSQLVSNLTPGRAVLDGPVPAQVVTFPNVMAEHVRALVSPGKAASGAIFEPLRATSATSGEVGWDVVRSGGEVPPEAADEADDPFEDPPVVDDPVRQRVLKMLRAGQSQNAIIREVYGANGGEKYQRAAAEIRQIIQESMK